MQNKNKKAKPPLGESGLAKLKLLIGGAVVIALVAGLLGFSLYVSESARKRALEESEQKLVLSQAEQELKSGTTQEGDLDDGSITIEKLSNRLRVAIERAEEFEISGPSTGSLVRGISGSSAIAISNSGGGYYTIFLITTCSEDQILEWDDLSGEWKCSDNSGGGASSLSELSDVESADPTNGNILMADGSDWRNVSQAGITELGTITTGIWRGTSIQDDYISAFSGASKGDILYYDGSNWQQLGAGVAGQYLQTQGAGANPQWAAGGGSTYFGLNGNVIYNTVTTRDFAIGANTLVAPFSVDEGSNIVRVGDAADNDAVVRLYSTDGNYGGLEFDSTDDRWEFTSDLGNINVHATGSFVSGSSIEIDGVTNTITGSGATEIATSAGDLSLNPNGDVALNSNDITGVGTDITASGTLTVTATDAQLTLATTGANNIVLNGGQYIQFLDNIDSDISFQGGQSIITSSGDLTLNPSGNVAFGNNSITGLGTSVTAAGALALNSGGQLTLGDGGDSVVISSSNWDVSSAGVIGGVTGFTSTGNVDLSGAQILGASPLVFEGNTDDDTTATFAFTDPTANRTITFQDASGTVAYLSNIGGAGLWTQVGNDIYYDTGQVGVGIDPDYLFHVSGAGVGEDNNTVNIENTNNASSTAHADIRVVVAGASGGDPYMHFVVETQTDWSFGLDNSDSDKFKISNHYNIDQENVITIDTGHNVGIGTESPGYLVHISGDDSGYGNNTLMVENSGSGAGTENSEIRLVTDGSTGGDPFVRMSVSGEMDWIVGVDNSDSDNFKINSSWNFGSENVMTLDGDHEVGIGTESPDRKLDVEDNSSGDYFSPVIAMRNTGATTSYHAGLELEAVGDQFIRMTTTGGSDWTMGIDVSDSGKLKLGTSWRPGLEEVMTVTTSRDVGIGTTGPVYRLEVEDNLADYTAHFFNDGNNQNRYGVQVQGGADAGTGTTIYFNALDGDGDQIGGLRNNSGTFELFDISDRRTKTNIADTNIDGLGIINGLRVTEYNRKQDPNGRKIYGFIAQQVRGVFPNMVAESPNGLLSVSKESLIPILTLAIQEHTGLIEELNSDIESMDLNYDDSEIVASMGSLEERVTDIEDKIDKGTDQDIPADSYSDEQNEDLPEDFEEETGESSEESDSENASPLIKAGEKFWNFLEDITFKGKATFEKSVTFLADMTVGGRLIHGDSDRGGFTTISAGAQEVYVGFSRPYSAKPVVNVVPEGQPVNFAIKNVSGNGFTVVLDEPISAPINFHWTALQIGN